MTLAGNKVYFPIESLTGLGHLNRAGKLVREMVEAGLEVTVAGGSFVDPQRFFAGAQIREIPPIVFNANGTSYTLNADGNRTILPAFNEAARREARTSAQLKNFHAAQDPNILITEFWPFNRPVVDREMEALIEANKATGDKALRIASVRDVLDPPKEAKTPQEIAERDARDAWIVKTINENFDAVLVHGDSKFIPLSETFASADKIKVPVVYTGYVVGEHPARPAACAPDAPVVVSCGAGHNCHELIFAFLTSWQRLLARRDTDPAAAALVNRPVHIITGPRFETTAFDDVKEWAKIIEKESGQPVAVERYREDFTAVLAKAAFSVSYAGYNTTLETLAMDVPAVLIPNYAYYGGHMKINTEQLYRLKRLSEQGFAAYAEPDDVQNANKFADIMVREFNRQVSEAKPHPTLDFNGAAHTIDILSRLLEEKESKLSPAATPVVFTAAPPAQAVRYDTPMNAG